MLTNLKSKIRVKKLSLLDFIACLQLILSDIIALLVSKPKNVAGESDPDLELTLQKLALQGPIKLKKKRTDLCSYNL